MTVKCFVCSKELTLGGIEDGEPLLQSVVFGGVVCKTSTFEKSEGAFLSFFLCYSCLEERRSKLNAFKTTTFRKLSYEKKKVSEVLGVNLGLDDEAVCCVCGSKSDSSIGNKKYCSEHFENHWDLCSIVDCGNKFIVELGDQRLCLEHSVEPPEGNMPW